MAVTINIGWASKVPLLTKGRNMGIGVSIFLIAVGAILAFAVSATMSGINIATVGVILMIVGAIGILLELVLWAPRRRQYRSTTVADPGYAGRSRVVEERESLM